MNEVDLTVRVFGYELKNPIMLASCELGNSGIRCKQTAQAGAGAVVTKVISREEVVRTEYALGPLSPRTFVVRNMGTLVQVSGVGFLTAKDWCERELKIAKESGVPIVANFKAGPQRLRPTDKNLPTFDRLYADHDPTIWQREMEELEKAGVDWFEFPEGPPERTAYSAELRAEYIDRLEKIIFWAKEAVSVPIVIKLAYRYPADMAEAAVKVEQFGADGLTIGQGNEGIKIDINRGTLVGAVPTPRMNVNGREGFHLYLKCIFDVAQRVKIPVFGCHGIWSGSDVIEHIMAGAICSQMATCPIIEGLGAFQRINNEIRDFMIKKGYRTIDEMRGLAHKSIEARYGLKASVIEDLCNGCGLCETVCAGNTMAFEQASKGLQTPYIRVDSATGKAKVNQELCEGCGACRSICPTRAVEISGWDEV